MEGDHEVENAVSERQPNRVEYASAPKIAALAELEGERAEIGGHDRSELLQFLGHRAGPAANVENVQVVLPSIFRAQESQYEIVPADEPPVGVFQAVHPLVLFRVHNAGVVRWALGGGWWSCSHGQF